MYVPVSVCADAHMCGYLTKPGEGDGSFGAAVRNGCKHPSVGAENWTLVL